MAGRVGKCCGVMGRREGSARAAKWWQGLRGDRKCAGGERKGCEVVEEGREEGGIAVRWGMAAGREGSCKVEGALAGREREGLQSDGRRLDGGAGAAGWWYGGRKG